MACLHRAWRDAFADFSQAGWALRKPPRFLIIASPTLAPGFLAGLLNETRPLDPTTFVGISALLFAVGLVASYLPGRKAASVSPMEAMRAQ